MPATERRDLRTGSVVWQAYPSNEQAGPNLSASRRVDVVIVGAGITGALLAETLTSVGLSTLIIDRRLPARGSTAASTALLQFEIDKPLLHLAEKLGFDAAARAWRCSYDAVDGIGHLIRELAIPCGFRPRKAIYLAGNVLGPDELLQEAQLRQSIGLPSRYLNRAALLFSTGIGAEAGLVSDGAADVNPVQLTHHLLGIAALRGANVCAPVEIAEVVPIKGKVGLATRDGFEIEARAAVFATGYELAKGVPSKGHRRCSTWAFATAPQPQSLRVVSQSVIWEAADPYLYIRSTVDGRLIVGGEDEDIDDARSRDALLPTKVEALEEKTRALLPWLNVTAEYTWAGTFGESDSGLPSIGPVPGMPNCYAVLGYGGNGITFAFLAARLLRGCLVGDPHPDAALFAFT